MSERRGRLARIRNALAFLWAFIVTLWLVLRLILGLLWLYLRLRFGAWRARWVFRRELRGYGLPGWFVDDVSLQVYPSVGLRDLFRLISLGRRGFGFKAEED